MFEIAPFRKCPRCKSESFGTLSVGGNRVTKRCKECRYSHDEVLPDVDTYDPALLCLRTNEPLDFDPDGMSGGSAFVVQIVNGAFHAHFAGIVVTGGRDRFHIIKVGHIHRFLAALP